VRARIKIRTNMLLRRWKRSSCLFYA